MATYKRKSNFFETEEGVKVLQILNDMDNDDSYNTEPSYCANTELYPDNLMPFVDKHVDYLKRHPTTDPEHYISNLRFLTRIR